MKLLVVDEILTSHEQKIIPTTSLDESCTYYEIQKNRNQNVDCGQAFWLWNWILTKNVVTKFTLPKKLMKNTRKKRKTLQQLSKKQKTIQFLSLLMYTAFCFQFFPLMRCKSTNSSFTPLKECMCTNLTFPTTSTDPSLNTMEFCKGYNYQKCPVENMDATLSETFFIGRIKLLSRPDVFMLVGMKKLVVDFFPTAKSL